MGIAGVSTNSYNYYGMQYPKNSHVKGSGTTNTSGVAPSTHTIHGNSQEYGKVLGGIGFPDGSNASVYKSKNYTTDNPVFLVMTWDAEGNKTETEIDASKVDPSNASLQEMMALNANRKLNGEESFEDEVMMSAGRLHGDETSSGYEDFFTKNNWISEIEDFMDMQHMLGNVAGYLRYKRASEILQSVSDAIVNIGKAADKADGKEQFSKMAEQYAQKVKEKIKNGETEPTYQIGGQTFTESEWEKLIEKMDKNIEQIQAEQADRLEKQNAEEVSNSSIVSVTDSSVSEAKVQELLKDNNERRFEVYGPNAPDEVKQAWMEAAEETGVNGMGMQMGHITQLDVQRAIKWYNGEDTDVLGTTVESAKQAVEKALYDLENPLEPNTNKSASIQKSIEKEKEFYKAFLEKLKEL